MWTNILIKQQQQIMKKKRINKPDEGSYFYQKPYEMEKPYKT